MQAGEGGLLCECVHACVMYAGCRTLVCKLICECVYASVIGVMVEWLASTCSSYFLDFIERCIIKCFG